MNTLRYLIRYHGDNIKVKSQNGTVVRILGLLKSTDPGFDRAYGYLADVGPIKPGHLQLFLVDQNHWWLWVEPKPAEPVPHWRAIYRCGSQKGAEFTLSGTLYRDEDQGREGFGRKFMRLATELPPVMLIPGDQDA